MTIATGTLNQLQIGRLVYAAEGPETDRPDMRVEPGRLHRIDLPAAGSLESHGVIESPCPDPGGHQLEHDTHCKRVYNADLIRSAGDIIFGARGCAILEFSYGRHESRQFCAISEKGLVLLCVDDVNQRYEWRFPPEPLDGGRGSKDRAPLTFGGYRRRGDFAVQSFSIMFATTSSRTGYIDVEGDFVAFPIFSQVPEAFPGDSALIKGWIAARQAHC